MKVTDKILYLTSQFKKDMPLPKAGDTIDSINIEGYANTTSVDRTGDIIPMPAWNTALENYLKNPIILAYHDHDEPIGRMVDYRVDAQGLWVKARISAAAEDVFNLVKDGVLTAFSVGFIIKDAMYDSVTDLFVIKELELLEISVVSVPANQDSIFSLSKSFETDEDYSKFKSQFAAKSESAKGLESSEPSKIDPIKKEWNMDPKELEVMLAKAAEDAATKAVAAVTEKALAEKAAAEKAAKEEKEINDKIAAAIKVGQSGAEKLLTDIETRIATQEQASKDALAGLEATIREKTEELAAIQKSKMNFSDKDAGQATTYEEREKAVLAAKIMGKSLGGTKFGSSIIEKTGAHEASATWELEVSLTMESEIRRRLVIAPLVRQIAMQTNVMTIPVNPEAGLATWMANSSFGTTASPGAAQVHQLKEITLNAYKVATMEYLAYEEEEDALLVLLPIIRDAMIRRVARAVDKAFALGAGSGADPVKGMSLYDATSVVTPTSTGAATIANLRALRKDLGYWGLDPAELVYVVSTEIYYDLLEDTSFQTMNQVGVQATLLTGQVGSLGNTPVLVSDAFPTKTGGTASATTNIGAFCIAPANFIAGNQRGLRFDTQDLVETQRKVLVASLRTGMTQLSTVNGMGISTLRWS
jgi:HK97 family phage prohead protease/HK97 family phage major capsid protein